MAFLCHGKNCKKLFSTKSNKTKHEKLKNHGPQLEEKTIIHCVDSLYHCSANGCVVDSKYKHNILGFLILFHTLFNIRFKQVNVIVSSFYNLRSTRMTLCIDNLVAFLKYLPAVLLYLSAVLLWYLECSIITHSKSLCALCWYFVLSLFSFSFNLTYDCFSLFLLRVIFLAYHICLLSRFPFWSIPSHQTPNIISEQNIMFILYLLTKLFSYILRSNLTNRSCKVSQISLCGTDFLDFFTLWYFLNQF